jgi:RNA polymerase sigma-70 factor (ECF subfamily)
MELVIGGAVPQRMVTPHCLMRRRGRWIMEGSDRNPCEDTRWQELLDGVRRGEAGPERALVTELYPRVAGIIGSLRPRRELVEDLAQEVFLRVFTRLDQFRGGSFVAWVDAIARRVCYDALRKQRVRPEWRFADLPEEPPGMAVESGEGSSRESAELLERLFARMDPAQVWLLREVELAGRTSDEVAREMGWTKLAGRLRLMRARRALGKCFQSMEKKDAP